MDLKNASKAIKSLNPKNISGTIPQAHDLVEALKKVTGKDNPKMPQAVNPQALQGMMKHVQSMFSQKKKKKREEMTPEEQAQEDFWDAQISELENEPQSNTVTS